MRVSRLPLCCVLIGWISAAAQINVPLANPSFETPSLAADQWTTGVPGWTLSPGAMAGVWRAGSSYITNGASDGTNIVFVNNGTVSQETAATIQAGVTYSLSIDVAQRSDQPASGYSVALVAAGTVIASDNGTLHPAPGQWMTTTIGYTAGAGDALTGQPISVVLTIASGSQADFDNVRFTESQDTTQLALSFVNPASSLPGKPVALFGSNFGSAQGTVLLGSTSLQVESWTPKKVAASLPADATSGLIQVCLASCSNSVALSIIPSTATVVPVANSSFEAPNLSDGSATGELSDQTGSWANYITSWTQSGESGVFLPSAVAFPDGITDGAQTLWLWNGNVEQTLGTTIAANTTYVLQVDVGQRKDDAAIGYSVQLLAGSTILATDSSTLHPDSATWLTSTLTYSSASDPSLVGQPITIRISETASQPNFDNLRFYAFSQPQITNVNPNASLPGGLVVISGSGFGAIQGSATVSLAGVPLSVSSWADTQIIALLPPTTSSGMLQVSANGFLSNSVKFSILSAASPTLSSMTPNSGGPGTAVTITGANLQLMAGFGYSVSFNGIPAPLLSVTADSIVTTVPFGASTGPVIVLVGANQSNPLQFTVPATPSISGLSSSTGVYGDSITISGAGFGASQDSGLVTFNGIPASVGSWSDSSIVATVPTGTTSGPLGVKVNGVSSNLVPFNIPLRFLLTGNPTAPATAISIAPASAFILVGGSVQLSLANSFGEPIPGATWSVSDSNVANLSTDDPPVLNAITSGSVLVTASWQGFSAKSTISVSNVPLSEGAIGSTAPGPIAGSLQEVLTGLGNPGDATVFSIETDAGGAAYVRAMDNNGATQWVAPTGMAYNSSEQHAADAHGGVLFQSGASLEDVQNGTVAWRIDSVGTVHGMRNIYTNFVRLNFAVAPDFSVYAIQSEGQFGTSGASYIGAFDGFTGAQKFRSKLPSSTALIDAIAECGPNTYYIESAPSVGPVLLSSDGTAYTTIFTTDYVSRPFPNYDDLGDRQCPTANTWRNRVQLVRIFPDGSSSVTVLKEWNESTIDWKANGFSYLATSLPRVGLADLVSDGEAGVLASWTEFDQQTFTGTVKVMHSADPGAPGNEITFPWAFVDSLVVGENGRAFLSGVCNGDTCADNALVGFDINSGTQFFQYQSPYDEIQPIVATADGGLIAKEGPYLRNGIWDDPNQVFHLDSVGQKTALSLNAAGLDHFNLTDWGEFIASSAGNVTHVTGSAEAALSGSAKPNNNNQKGADPKLKLVGTEDCTLVSPTSQQGVFNYERFPKYRLQHAGDSPQVYVTSPDYTVYEQLDRTDQTDCRDSNHRLTGRSPCGPADGSTIPFNEFDDDLRGNFFSSQRLAVKQSFLYGLANQRDWPIQRIERYGLAGDRTTYIQRAVPSVSFLTIRYAPNTEPTIDGMPGYTGVGTYPYIGQCNGVYPFPVQ